MTAIQPSRLMELEAVVERGLATFVEVGKALAEIRDSRLYREAHSTFEEYVRERWGWSRDWAYKQIEAATVAGNVDTYLHRGHASLLAPLPAEEQRILAPVVAELPVREAREVVRNHRMGVHYSSETPEWSTPQDLFDELHSEFHFTLDVCATPENTKCERFFTETDDGLAQDWKYERCWMNPPYGAVIGQWIEKAWVSANNHGAKVVCLVPARVDTGWWWSYCRYGEIRFLRGRLRFGGEAGAPFPSAIVIFPNEAKVVWWDR